ncbi:MAG TPA: histidine ammonia-lyase [Candidatus Saccharimonadales bacterium]|nr:histidine ammonia-lyase [Candidatus Saccharimonadales bacterium]
MSQNPVTLDGLSLTLDQVVDVARRMVTVEIAEGSIQAISRSRQTLEELAREGRIVYGVTTGFGALSNTRISLDQQADLQKNLLRSHACGVGKPLTTEEVRAIMLLRLSTLTKGLSGVRPAVALMIQNFLNHQIHPIIPSKGSVGASGDLAPLSHMALALMGEGDVEFHGKIKPASTVLNELGLSPVSLTMKEGLAMNNGTQMSTAVAALVVYDAQRLLKIADIATAISLEALNGFTQAFDRRIHDARPYVGQIDSASNIRAMIAGSELVCDDVEDGHAQDAYSLRCAPQVMGAAREATAFARRLIEVEINSATDNPLVFSDSRKVLSGGNFHGQIVGLAMDTTSLALTMVSNLSERRVFRLLDSKLNKGLPAFLVGSAQSPGLSSGLMAVQYTAAALASENKILVHPATADTIPTSADQEDFVSMSPSASLKARLILENVKHVVAIELLSATQALEFRDRTKCGKGTEAAYSKVRERVAMVSEDRQLSGDIEMIVHLISDNSILQAVESRIGPLK